MSKNKDISGQRFGKLLAAKQAPDRIKPNGERVPYWLCVCECGNTRVVRRSDLLSGHSTSCGCTRKKKPGRGIKVCAFHPVAVNCNALNCQKCGWNPYNKRLIAERIKKIKIKAGMAYDESDESESAAADI